MAKDNNKKREMQFRGQGFVYVLCFIDAQGRSAKLQHAAHYVGWARSEECLMKRIEHHRRGTGARITAAVINAGLSFLVAAKFDGGPELEQRIKRSHGTKRYCPNCRAKETGRVTSSPRNPQPNQKI